MFDSVRLRSSFESCLIVAEDHDLLARANKRQRLIGVALRGLVDDHHVEEIATQREDAADVLGTHDPAREDLGENVHIETRRVLELFETLEAFG